MFYVPQDEFSPNNQKTSFKIIKKLTQICSKLTPTRKTGSLDKTKNLSSNKRFKTLDIETQNQKRNSVPCRCKNSFVNLPVIQQKKFVLRGSEFNPNHKKTLSSRKVSYGYEKKLKSFKEQQKFGFKDRKGHKILQSFDKVAVYLQPWIVSQDFPAY